MRYLGLSGINYKVIVVGWSITGNRGSARAARNEELQPINLISAYG